jgi:hypothetical protein
VPSTSDASHTNSLSPHRVLPIEDSQPDGDDDDNDLALINDDDEPNSGGGNDSDSELQQPEEPASHVLDSQSGHPLISAHPPQLRDHLPSAGPRDTPAVVQTSRLRSFPWHRNRGATWANPDGANFTTSSEDDSKWEGSRQAEMDSLLKAGTYSLVRRPPGVNVVGCKWVDKEKPLPDGSVKLKSRLVAQGFTQRPGVDFYETHSPTVRLDSLRGLLALAAHHDWEIHHMDVKGAYLNGVLEETIYMRQPKGFEVPGKEDLVCLLHKGLYGLKQAGRAWHQTIDPAHQRINLTPLASDHCVYLHRDEQGVLILALYVDDLFIFASSLTSLRNYKKQLHSLFEMEDLGEARLILGM